MRIDLRGRQARMAEHFLNAAQIGTAFYQVGRKRVTHIMRRERLVEPRGKQTLLEHFAKRIGRHLIATRAHEEIRALFAGKQRRARVEKVVAHGSDGYFMQRHVISWNSAGTVGFKGSRKSTPFAAQMAAEQAAKTAMEHGLKKVAVFVKGPGSGRETAIRSLQAAGLEVSSIQDCTPIPHNGCRPCKRRRC